MAENKTQNLKKCRVMAEESIGRYRRRSVKSPIGGVKYELRRGIT